MASPKTCCYFAISEPTMARNAVLIKGLERNGVKVMRCIDNSSSWRKFVGLVRKHRELKDAYDFLLVGYLSNMVVPLARLISKKRVVYNALCSMYEGAVLDRQKHGILSPRRYLIWFIDFLAFHSAHLVLVETESQKEFLNRVFLVPRSKMKVTFTGADDEVFYPDASVQEEKEFTALFRGWFLPATGVEYVIEAARVLKSEPIRFRILGRGPLEKKVREMIASYGLTNVELETAFLPERELLEKMLACHVVLGQFTEHPRLDRTIQNKTFEALALRKPYITRDSKSNRELLTDGTHCLFARPADAEDLAEKILLLRDDPKLRKSLAENGYRLFVGKLSPSVLGKELIRILL